MEFKEYEEYEEYFKNQPYPHIGLLLDSELDTEDDNWVQFRETMAKQNELFLCIIGQEMPLIDGIAKRKKWDNINQGVIAEKYGFDSTWNMNITILSILEKEWGYAKIDWGNDEKM
tara:strand:+ start:401 stop:748 length:348 start_codon:yes stop_codon:yes gene_type:complete